MPERRPAPHVAAAQAAVQAKTAPQGRPAGPAPHVQAALGRCAQPRMPGMPGAPAPRQPAAASAVRAPRPPGPGAVQRSRAPLPARIAPPPARRPAAVVQRAARDFSQVDINDPAIYMDPTFPWEEWGEWERERTRLQSVQNRVLAPPPPPHIEVSPSLAHLEQFAKKTDQITEDTPANQVLTRATATPGALKAVAEADQALEQAITRPDDSNAVTDTVGDGEVQPLIQVLKAFKAHLVKNANQNPTYELAFSGSHGACDGCKKRIDRFVRLWTEAASAVMLTGRTARLKFTYRYLVPAKAFPREWGENVYGWATDGYNPPLFHTIDAIVRGNK